MALRVLISLMCLSAALVARAEEAHSPDWWQERWVAAGARDHEEARELKRMLDLLASTMIGGALLEEAKSRDPGFLDRIKVGDHSITETVFSRSFSLHDGKETIERENYLTVSRNLSRRDAVLDLGHELTHFIFRAPASPYKLGGSLEDFIRDGIEGLGGELDAFVMECRISIELETTKRLPAHPICPRYRRAKSGAQAVDREAARMDFYRVGGFLAGLKAKALSIREISGSPVVFTSSYAKAPYPVALTAEFRDVRRAACENNSKKAALIAREASRRKLGREPSGSSDSLAKERARLKRFARENCSVNERSSSLLKKAKIRVGKKRLEVEVARTLAEQEHGLMGRVELPSGTGMLFEYESEQELIFWMKNTKIALDIGFFDGAGKLINVETMVPDGADVTDEARPRYRSQRPAKYALEVPVGWFGKNGILPGAALQYKPLK